MKILLSLTIMLICSLPSLCFSAESGCVEENVLEGCSWSIPFEDYRGKNGVWLSFDQDGNIFIKKDENTVLYKGKITITFYGKYQATNYAFVAAIDFGDDSKGFDHANGCVLRDDHSFSYVIGKFRSGEGDPNSLIFFEHDNDFGCRLKKSFPDMKGEVLHLSSRGVTGEWPEYLDETNDSEKKQESNK